MEKNQTGAKDNIGNVKNQYQDERLLFIVNIQPTVKVTLTTGIVKKKYNQKQKKVVKTRRYNPFRSKIRFDYW